MNSSAWEKLHGAMLSLARAGALKDRLTDAYRNHLSHIDADDLPKDLRERFRAFSDRVTRERPLVRGDDAFRATIRKLSADEAENVAMDVVGLFAAIQRRDAGLSRERLPAGANVVPLYIAETRVAEA